MKYIALLRGINAGKLRRVDMKRLKALFETLGYANVSTYINSGNVFFEAEREQGELRAEVEAHIKREFGFDVPTLIKTSGEMQKIATAIPKGWQNDAIQKSDVAYLFPAIDTESTLDELPFKREFIDVRYTKGAILWNVKKSDYNKSHLNKIVSHKLYQLMTVRNVNTARYLANNSK